jgi:Protein of unknown function (DUF3618)
MAQDSDEVARNANPVTPTPATSPPSASTDELRAGIHETRAEISQTINAIQERLSPDHLVSNTKDAIKDATVERAKQVAQGASRAADIARDAFENPGRVMQRVKANPVPAAVVTGVAAMWLAVRALRRPRAAHKDRVLRGEEERTTWRRRSGIGRVRSNGRLLVGVGTGMACWGMWRARRSVSGEAPLDRHPNMTARQPAASAGAPR